MKIIKILRLVLPFSLIINPSLAKAELSLEESTYCYAVSLVMNIANESLANVSEELDRDLKSAEVFDEKAIKDSEDFKKAFLYNSPRIKKGIDTYKNLSISKLVKNGKSLSDAHLILDTKYKEIIKKQLLFDSKKISWGTYAESLGNLFNDCAVKYTNELKKNH